MLEYPEGDRFAVSTPDNRQAGIWIASLLSLMYSFVILCTRLVIKWGFFAADDIALAGAYILSLAHWVILYLGLHRGLGKAPSLLGDDIINDIGRLLFTSRILFLTALGLSKCAVVAFVAQLFTKTNERAWMLCCAAGAVTAVWTFAAPLIVSVGCHPAQTATIDGPATCSSELTRWRVVTAIDFVLECLLVALPSLLILDVQMNFKRKTLVMLAFSFRLGNAVLIVVFLLSYTSALSSNHRASIGITDALIWQEALLAYALMSATIPVLKGFIGSFDTSSLVQIDQSNSGIRSYRYGSTAHHGASDIGSITASGVHDGRGQKRSDTLRLRPENANVATSIWHEQDGDESSGRGGSEDGIIRIEREVRSHSTS